MPQFDKWSHLQCQDGDERPFRAGIDPSSSFRSRQPRLINPSPPRSITPGRSFIPYDMNMPPVPAAVEKLVTRMRQQTLETLPVPQNIIPNTTGIDLISDTNPIVASEFPYPLQLEIDAGTESTDLRQSSVTVDPIIVRPMPSHVGSQLLNSCLSTKQSIDSNIATAFTAAVQLGDTEGKDKDMNRRILDMISNETQCTVHRAPTPSPISLALPSNQSNATMMPPQSLTTTPNSTEVNGSPAEFSCMNLEVDENPDENDTSWIETIVPLRKAATPGGVKKHGLRYRASHEAALRCENLVRSIPRMRRRNDKPRPKSIRDNYSTSTGPVNHLHPSKLAVAL